MTPPPIRRLSPWRQGLNAAKENLLPGLVLQAFALAVLLAYYFHPLAHAALESLAAAKARLGWVYSLFATSLCGGLAPFLYLRLSAGPGRAPWRHGAFYLCFWGYKGVEVDFFYRAQGWMFGNDASFATVAAKVAFDQFFYSVVWALPFALLAFHWKDEGFRLSALNPRAALPFLREAMPRNLFGAWGVWIPAVAVVYSLPPTLQVPLFNLVLCFYALMLIALTRKAGAASASAAPAPADAAHSR